MGASSNGELQVVPLGEAHELLDLVGLRIHGDRLATPPWRFDRAPLRCGHGVTPGQQLVDPGDLMVGDAAEHIGEPGLRVDAIEFCRFDHGVGDGGRSAASS